MADRNKSLHLMVIELSKSSQDASLKDKLESSDDGYLCLGHFDYFRISPPNGEDPLQAIESDFKKRDNYNYPLYILHNPMDDSTLLASFWKTQSCFMSISRVHFCPTAKHRRSQLRSALQDLHEGAPLADGQPGELSIRVLGERVHAVFYHTLELSDLVVVLKTNSILSCLESIRRLMEVAQVGDVYSFCGVHGNLCRPETDAAIQAWDKEEEARPQHCFDLSAKDAMAQKIPYASMRFSVTSTHNAKKFWENTSRSPHFISGTADAIINFNGASVKELVNYISYLAIRTVDIGRGSRISAYDAFGDIITRIGCQYGSTYIKALALGPKEPIYGLKKAQESIRDAVSRLPQKDTRWFDILASQTDSLITMMGNCITDDLSILIWPSVQALIDRLTYLLRSRPVLKRTQEAEVGKFLDSWNIVENDISRLEGQLSQKPELLPSRYYIPATLLAFYMALLHEYNEYLLTINRDEDQGYIPLLTYNVEPRARTLCVLDPSMDGLRDAYNKATPLLVSMPISMLYCPMEAVIVLCHELSHYVGASTRLRERRFELVLTSLAELIALQWKLDGRNTYPLCKDGSVKIQKALFKRLKGLYPSHAQYYIADLKMYLNEAVIETFYDRSLRSNLLQHNLENTDLALSVMLHYAKAFDEHQQNRALHEIWERTGKLLTLYRECYADLTAVMALELSAEEYMLNIFYREAKYIEETSSMRARMRLQVLQIQAALVLQTLNKDFTSPLDATLPLSKEQLAWLKNWEKDVNYYREAFQTGKDVSVRNSTGIIMYVGEYSNLSRYLEECRDALEEGLKRPEVQAKRQKLTQMAAMVRNHFELASIQKGIMSYRDTLLNSCG